MYFLFIKETLLAFKIALYLLIF